MDDLASLHFQFAAPWWLLALLPVPLLWWLRGKMGQRAALRFSSTALAGQVAMLVKSRPGRWARALRPIALACAIIALARPQFGHEQQQATSSGVDIMLTADLSNSMWAYDFVLDGQRTDRLTVVKSVLHDFIQARPYDRLGLIAFASEPYLVSPLTTNHRWLQHWVDDLHLGLIDGRRTAVGDALGRAVNRLNKLEAKSKVVILLTDGSSNSGKLDPMLAAEAAKASGVKVYTIGVGQEGIVPFPRINPMTNQPELDRQGRIYLEHGRSEIDLETLRQIADHTGGKFYAATNTEELKGIYNEIDQLEKRDVTVDLFVDYAEAFIWPLGLALGLVVLEALLNWTLYRRLP